MKKTLLIAASFGAGAVLVLAILAGGGYWYISSRPKSPKPWNAAALTSVESPAFAPDDSKHISFSYRIKNNTEWDYKIDSAAQITCSQSCKAKVSVSLFRDLILRNLLS